MFIHHFLSGCLPGIGWKNNCSTVTGQSFGCLSWNQCRSEGDDSVCLSGCRANKVVAHASAVNTRDEIRVRMFDPTYYGPFVANLDIGGTDSVSFALAPRKLTYNLMC